MKNDNDILNTAEIPYEVRMKYIIKAYREDQEKWGKQEAYAKHFWPQDLEQTLKLIK